MDFLDKQIPPPKSWDKFEDLTCGLFAAIWQQPATQKNGRQGQSQNGVDVYGQPTGADHKWYGVQCKGKSRGYGAKVTAKEFDKELAKAETFEPGLSHWILASTSPNDGALQKHVRKVSDARVKAGKFPVDIMFWETILGKLAEQPAILQQFYPEHFSSVPDTLAIIAGNSATALAAIDDKFRAGDREVVLPRERLVQKATSLLVDHNHLRITGEGGMGKSVVLRRIVDSLAVRKLVLKDNRTSAATLKEYFGQVGITDEPQLVIDAFGKGGECICAIDGADRLLLSDRRGVVTDLLRCIAQSPNRSSWAIISTARQYQGQDIVATALREAGFLDLGASIEVSALDDEDVNILTQAFPDFQPVLRRGDLANQNRSPFLIREMLLRSNGRTANMTELDLADAWATSGSAHRAKALSELGAILIARPVERPPRAQIDPLGAQQLIAEGCLTTEPMRDAVTLTYDVHEDWLLARNLSALPGQLRQNLKSASEPLWWLRAIRLVGQILLETGKTDEWHGLVLDLQQDQELDPVWGRAALASCLYSEKSHAILPLVEPYLLKDNAKQLSRLIETLIIAETRLNEDVLASGDDLNMAGEALLTLAAQLKVPNFRSWSAFLRWSLPKWREWPPTLIPSLSELADIFTRSTSRIPNDLSRQIAETAQFWLIEIEDARDWSDWESRQEPFGVELADYEGWNNVGSQLRIVLRDCLLSSEKTVSEYLKRLTNMASLTEPRRELLEHPGAIPNKLPKAWVDMCITQFLPRKRRYRPGPESFFGPELFSRIEFNSSGIKNDRGFFPSAPTRGGFADLFKSDEKEALRLFHRLEMRAAVFYRWFSKCEDRQRPLPLVLQTGTGSIPLWGDDRIYRWSRGGLGSHVLGSAYLALDDWMSEQAKLGRPVAELMELVLQPNGLVATAAVCIGLLKEHVNTPRALDSAAPFLAEPRLWNYDIRGHIDDQSSSHRIGFWSADDIHFRSVEANYRRRQGKQPLSHALLLPFRLLANADAQEVLDARRATWKPDDLADFGEQRTDHAAMQEFADRIARCLSDSDPKQITFEQGPEDDQVLVQIQPPEEAVPEIEAMNVAQAHLNAASKLAVWAEKSRDAGRLQDGLTIQEAVLLAQKLESDLSENRADDGFAMTSKLGPAAIVGTAAMMSKFAGDSDFAEHANWAKPLLLAGAYLRRGADENSWLVDQAILSFDAQVMAAWGLAAFACRQAGDDEVEKAVFAVIVQRLQAVTKAALQGLDWATRPAFARLAHNLALESCIIDVGHWWRGEKHRLRAADRTDRRRVKLFKLAQNGRLNMKMPEIPPHPFRWEWRWTGKWPKPLQRLKLRTPVVLDWDRATAVLKETNWTQLCADGSTRKQFEDYLRGLVQWTRAYAEEDENRHDSHYPYEWADALAHALGSLSAAHGVGALWESLLCFSYRDRAEDLVGEYLESVTRELIFSERKPDERFWSAWKPAAEWVMANHVPKHRSKYNKFSNAVRAAGFVGPYMTPIPEGWPWLDDFLPWIDRWVSATCHLPSSIAAVIPIAERMKPEQRCQWFVPWLQRAVDESGADVSFWSHSSCGDKATALLRPLATLPDVDRSSVRRSISLIADAGSSVARDVLPLFASKRPA